MKKVYLTLLILFGTMSMMGQNQTFTGVKTFTSPPKFSNLLEGTKNDSVLVYDENKNLRYIPASVLLSGATGDYLPLTGGALTGTLEIDANLKLGDSTSVNGYASFAQGRFTTTNSDFSHAEGRETITNNRYSHSEGQLTQANGEGSHAEGYMSHAEGKFSHAEGRETGTYTNDDAPHTPNYFYSGEGNYTHTEGFRTVADANYSHAEGKSNATFAQYSHVEGDSNTTGYPDHSSQHGAGSHAEGYSNHTYADYSHVEGKNNETYGEGAHAEGYKTKAYGFASHSSGIGTVTNEDANGQFAMGKYNIDTPDALGVIGNGTGDGSRSNLVEFYNNSIVFNQPVTFAGGGGGCGCETPQTIEIENPSCDPEEQPITLSSKNVVINVTYSSGGGTAGILLPPIAGTQGTHIDIIKIYNGGYGMSVRVQADGADGDIIVGTGSTFLNDSYNLSGKTVYTVRSNGVYWIVD